MKKHYFVAKYLVPLGLLLGVGCGGPSADQACSDSAKAMCNKLDQCRKNGTQITYGTLGQCINRLKANCLASLMAPKAGNDPGAVEKCAMALPNESCQDYLQNNPVDDCVPKHGDLQNGAMCAFNTQCQTNFCAVQKGGNCGTCQPPPVPGDPCTDTGCGRNLVCTPNQICATWVAAGGQCDSKNLVCAPGQACVSAVAGGTGTCRAKATTVGASCDPKLMTAANCDSNLGLFCEPTTMKCAAQTYAGANAACGVDAAAMSDAVCDSGGQCVNSGGGSPSMCVAASDAGGSCDTAMGPPCLAPARCVASGGTSGTCMLLDATMCM